MNWLHRIRPLLFVFGGVLIISSLFGARWLTHNSGGGTDNAKANLQPTNGRDGSGPVVLGYVDSDPPPVNPGLPPILQSGEVDIVYVKPGDEVKVNDQLYKFNTAILEAKHTEALRAVDTANAKLAEARGAADLHATKVSVQKKVIEASEKKVKLSLEAWQLAVNVAKEQYKLAGFDPKTWDERIGKEVKIYELYKEHTQAEIERDVKQAELAGLESALEKQVKPLVASAQAEVKRYEAMAAEAQTAINLCTVRAKVAGTIERVNVSPGDVLGVGTRTPALVLVPSGARVVRAEVEAEFAHRVGPDKIGKTVTIYDNSDPDLAYMGTVKQIGTAFLNKRGNSDGLIPSETRVLEVVIVVSGSRKPENPPLRVGQKVRVDFGQ